MKRLVILGFLALMAVDTTQQILGKLTGDKIGAFSFEASWLVRLFNEQLLLAVLCLYVVAFVIYSWLLRHAPVGPSYLALHGYVVVTFLISMFYFGERFTLLQLCGCALILGGIVLLAATEEL